MQNPSPLTPENRPLSPHLFERPRPGDNRLASLIDEAGRMRAFLPPFRFTSFFSPEDTLLCVLASEAALAHARKIPEATDAQEPIGIVELTTGSGLVGLHLLRLESKGSLVGLDVDALAIDTATRNATTLGLAERARFECADLWDAGTNEILAAYHADLIICNPPYVPEPSHEVLAVEAGSGADGTAHLERTLELVKQLTPRAMALSWCSLSDPARIVRDAARAGYVLNSLFVAAIADGEYSGSVHSYLRDLDTAYINESSETKAAIASDGSARFSYLLMAGDFSRGAANPATADAVERMCESFASTGLAVLENPEAPIPVRTWLLDRWDEVRLRAFLHGPRETTAATVA